MALAPIPLSNIVNLGSGNLTTGNLNLDGTTGAYVTCFTAAAAGSVIYNIRAKAQEDVVDGLIRFWLKQNANRFLLGSIIVTATKHDENEKTWEGVWTPGYDLLLGSASDEIIFATTNSEKFDILVVAADYA